MAVAWCMAIMAPSIFLFSCSLSIRKWARIRWKKIKSAELGLCVFWPIEIGLHCSWRGAYEWKTATTRPHRVAGAFAPLSFWLGGHPLFRFLTKRMVSASEVFGFFFLVGCGGGVEAQGENETENRLLCVEKFSTFISHTQNGVYLLVLLGSSNSLSLSHRPLCCLSKFFEMHSHTQPRTHHRIVPLLHTKLNFFLWFLFNFYMALWLILWHFLPALFSCTLH